MYLNFSLDSTQRVIKLWFFVNQSSCQARFILMMIIFKGVSLLPRIKVFKTRINLILQKNNPFYQLVDFEFVQHTNHNVSGSNWQPTFFYSDIGRIMSEQE